MNEMEIYDNKDELSKVIGSNITGYYNIDEEEIEMLNDSINLLNVNYPKHALLELWNASVHNIRRRVEAYGVDIFISSNKKIKNNKDYKPDRDTLGERRERIKDEDLLKGAVDLSIINRKTFQMLLNISWMRNHASASHDNSEEVTREDFNAFMNLISNNLFKTEFPEPTHSISTLLEPIKNSEIDDSLLINIRNQISNYSNRNIIRLFNFCLDAIINGEDPTYSNVKKIFPDVWNKANETQRKQMGSRFNNYFVFNNRNVEDNINIRTRLYELLVLVQGIKYIPDQTRALIYGDLIIPLRDAKNQSYGWKDEVIAAKALSEVGPFVPSIIFDSVYQEILTVWCGNFWGRSAAHEYLKDFIFKLQVQEKIKLANLFTNNDRVKSELFNEKPKQRALELLDEIKDSFNTEKHKGQIELIIQKVSEY